MPVINIKNILQSYQQTLNIPAALNFPLPVKNCLQSVLGITNPTIGIGCAWGLLNTSDYDYVSNCLSNYGPFTNTQLQNLIDCISNCRVGATVYSTEKGPIQWYDCCGQIYNDIVFPNVPYVISGCIRNYSVLPSVVGSQPPITLSAVTYGGVNCDCPPPSPTPTPTVTPSFGYTPSPTPTPTITPTVTRTPTKTPTQTPTPTPTKSSINIWIPPTPEYKPPTPTPTTTASPTPTVTPSVSANITSISCGTDFGNTISALVSGPFTRTWKINLGTQTGMTSLFFDLISCNDRATVEWNNKVVIETGCLGNYAVPNSDPQCSSVPVAPYLVPYITNCDLRASFFKSAATPTFAYVRIKTPSPFGICEYSIFNARLSCPDGQPDVAGPCSLKTLETSSQKQCLSGDCLTKRTISVGDTITFLPNWSFNFPGVNEQPSVNNLYFEGGQLVPNPSNITNINDLVFDPNCNGCNSYNWQLDPTYFGSSWTKLRLDYTPNFTPGDGNNNNNTIIIPNYCGIGDTTIIGQRWYKYKPVTIQYNTPGTYSITIEGSSTFATPKCVWYKYDNYITVVP